MNRKVKPWIIATFLTPGLLMYVYFFLIPAIQAFYYSLTEWNGFSENKEFVGLGNFIAMFSDNIFITAIGNTMAFLVVGGVLVFLFVMNFTFLLTQKGFKGRKAFSNFFYFPNMISQAALAVLWVFVFSPGFGLMDMVLQMIGLENLIIPWLGSRVSAMLCIIVVTSFTSVGFYLILMLSGVDKIPETYAEAAAIDGASSLMIYFRVTLPLLRDVIVIAITMWIINSIKYFEMIWAMFRGMNMSTQTLGTYMFTQAFGVAVPIFKLGYGSAIAVVMFLLVVVLVGTFRFIFEKDDLQY